MTDTSFHASFCISAEHPALPGHFPGRPVVPGVVLLDQFAMALQRWRRARIASLLQVKFVRPLLPGQQAELVLHDVAGSTRFQISHDTELIASGQAELAPEIVVEPATESGSAR